MIDESAAIGSMPFAWDNGVHRPGLFSPWIAVTANVGPFANVQAGTERETRIGEHAHVDAYVHVGHDAHVGEDCTLVAHSVICGHVTLEPNVYVGAGALIRQRLRIGEGAMIGMGAVVVRDVPPNCVVVGNPARFLKPRWPKQSCNPMAKWDGERWA